MRGLSKGGRSVSALGRRDRRLGILMILPVVAFMLFLVVYPLINLFTLSVQNYNMLSQTSKYVGLRNFERVVLNRKRYFKGLRIRTEDDTGDDFLK